MTQGPITQIGPYIFANGVRAAQDKTRLFVPHLQGAMKTWGLQAAACAALCTGPEIRGRHHDLEEVCPVGRRWTVRAISAAFKD